MKFNDLDKAILNLLLKILPYIAIIILIYVLFQYIKKRAKFGQIKIASRKKACGIIFGIILTWRGPKVAYSPLNDEGSVIGWGTSGTGKTDAILRPTINSISDKGTTFCIDISGDIVSSIHLRKKIVFGPNAKNSACYSVFAPVDRIRKDQALSEEEKHAKITEQLIKIASQMIPVLKDGEAEGGVVYFNNGGHDIIGSALIAGYFTDMDFSDICLKIYKMNWKQLFQWIDSCKISDASDLLGQFEGIKDEHKAGCIGVAKNAVAGIASNYSVRQFLHRPKKINGKVEPYYTPRRLETHSVFYVVNDGTDFDLYAGLTRLVVSQTMEYLQTRKVDKSSHTILLTLDEFSSLNLAKETAAAAKKYRKKKVRLLVLTQSIADMDLMTREGNTASRATIDNFPYRLILGAQDPQSQRYFADCVGKHKVNYGNSSGNQRPAEEYWIRPEDFGLLDRHLVLKHPKGHMVLGKNYYHKSTPKILIQSALDFSIRKWGVH